MRYSVIIPVFNRRQKVVRSIKSVHSLIRESDDTVEIVVVDDASKDGSAEAARIAGADRVVVLERNLGVTGARNRGIENSSGEILILLDSDDELKEDALVKIRHHFLKHPSTHILFGACIDRDGTSMHHVKARLGQVSYAHFLANSAPGEFLPVVRREVFDKILFQESLRGFEGITWLKAARSGFTLHYSEDILRIYDKEGEDRLCRRQNILSGADRLARGWYFFLREFGSDLWALKRSAYLGILFRYAVYSRIQKVKTEHALPPLFIEEPIRRIVHIGAEAICALLPRALLVVYLNCR